MKRWRRLPIALTAMLGVAASVAAFVWSASWANQVANIKFEDAARERVGLINSDLANAASTLDTVRAFFQGDEHPVSREEFTRFARVARSHTAGLRDLMWAPRVTARERDGFERKIRASGFPNFEIRQFDGSGKFTRAEGRADYYPVLYLQSVGLRQPPLGLDLGFSTTQRRAIETSIATTRPAATVPTLLPTSPRPRAGMLTYVPVYKANPTGPAAAVLTGLVVGSFDIDETVENIVGPNRILAGIDMYLFDPAGTVGDRLIYWRPGSRHPGATSTDADPPEAALRALPHWEGDLSFIDQTLGVLMLPSGGIRSGQWSFSALVPLAIGLLLTGQVTLYMLSSWRRTEKLEALTESLNRTTEGLNEQTERIARLARQDSLTGLVNRASFHEALSKASARAARGEAFALLCLDLDRFKQVNDTLGHPIGDALLRAVADRLRTIVRGVDTVARLGGDEFSVVQAGIAGPESAAILSKRIIEELRAPYDLEGHRVVVGVTVGIALGGIDDRDPDTLMRNADLALYRAKQEGRGVYRFFEPDMDERAQARRQLEMDLRGAVERDEFELHYQPLVSVVGRRVIGFEALIRWRHPTRGLVSPGDFIPLAEEIGLIVPIGAWVLRTACAEAANWPPRVSVAVNVSAVQFARLDVVRHVGDALRESGIAPERLELEITETALRGDSDTTLRTLRDLRSLGVRIAMDDFGTGYSALSYLRSFMFDKLKIDRTFINELAQHGESAAIARAIAGLGQSLGIATTAEGVETEEQMAQLVRDGFTELQGYLFARPCPASEVANLLSQVARNEAAA
jgi:diguanylate cyclase (GGDEF)-like protein